MYACYSMVLIEYRRSVLETCVVYKNAAEVLK